MTTDFTPYLEIPFKTKITTRILNKDQDSDGFYFEVQKTCVHTKGGGQLQDIAFINDDPILHSEIVKATVRHYVSELIWNKYVVNQDIEIRVDVESRMENAEYHTAGHIIGDIIETKYQVKVIKGCHYPGQSSLTFDNLIQSLETLQELVQSYLDELLISKNPIQSIIVNQFHQTTGKPFRILKLGQRGCPCGGTHISDLKVLKDRIQLIKLKKSKLSYKLKK